MTLISVAILVGTELVGAGAAAGWAIGGLFQLGETMTRILEGVLILTALDRTLLFPARGGRARADPRLAGRAGARPLPFRAIGLRTDGSPMRGGERLEHCAMPKRQ